MHGKQQTQMTRLQDVDSPLFPRRVERDCRCDRVIMSSLFEHFHGYCGAHAVSYHHSRLNSQCIQQLTCKTCPTCGHAACMSHTLHHIKQFPAREEG